jgi:hypothetical protein
MGAVTEDGSGRYSITPLGDEMRHDRLGPAALFFNSEHHLLAWLHLDHSVRTGERAFDFVFGMRPWEYYTTHPAEAAIFDRAMSSITGPVSTAVAEAYDFSRVHVVADIGGGDGTLLTQILRRHASVRGLLFDLPDVVERAREKLDAAGLLDRCEIVGGSFLDWVPPGADLYLMKSIIHDWEEPFVGTILEHCRAALGASGAPLLLIERVLPEKIGPEAMDDLLGDLDMLANPGGQERTESEYAALLRSAGFRLDRVIPTPTPFKVLESLPTS